MLKRIFVFFLAPIFLISFIFLALITMKTKPENNSNPNCGFPANESLAADLPLGARNKNWTVITNAIPLGSQIIDIEEHLSWKQKPVEFLESGCKLTFDAISDPKANGVDWRIGREFPAENFRGKIIKTTFFLRAKTPLNLPDGTTYSYDGKKVVGTSAKRIFNHWGKYEVVQRVAEDADRFEIWFRLFFNKLEATPDSNSIDFSALIEMVTEKDLEAYEAQRPVNTGGFTSVECQTDYSATKPVTDESYKNDSWLIYRHDSGEPAPDVKVENTDSGCFLVIDDAPTTSRPGIDWRIGKNLGLVNARGKTVTFSADLTSTPEAQFTSANIYIFDGSDISWQSFTELDNDTKEIHVSKDIPIEATKAEAWLRLVLNNGTIKPSKVRLKFTPKLSID